jgi:antitoxin YefM
MKTTLSVTEARRKFLQLVESKETITLQQREETVAFLVPRERMEALLETMEIMANPAAMRAVRRDRSGKGKYLPLSVRDEDEG